MIEYKKGATVDLKEGQNWLRGRFVDVNEERAEVELTDPASFRKGAEIEGRMYWAGAVYNFRAPVLEADGSRVVLGEMKDVHKLQRRAYLRMETVSLWVQCRKVSDEEVEEMGKFRVLNISGGGLLLLSPRLFEVGDVLEMDLVLPIRGLLEVSVLGEVVRVCSRAKDLWEVGVKFVLIDEWVRDRIVEYVFSEERKRIKGEQA